MQCEQVSRQLPAYITESMDEASRRQLEAHWTTCESCRREAQDILGIWTRLESLPAPPPSRDLRPRFEAMLDGYEQGRADAGPVSSHRRSAAFLPVWLQAAAALLLLVGGFVVGGQYRQTQSPAGLATLENEIHDLRQLVALSMLEQRSASRRLSGVFRAAGMGVPNGELVTGLLDTLDTDTNVNVRLAVVEALDPLRDDPQVREHLLRSLMRQSSPIVQVSMIDLLVEMREARSVPLLERLLDDPDIHPTVRDRAARGLAELNRPNA